MAIQPSKYATQLKEHWPDVKLSWLGYTTHHLLGWALANGFEGWLLGQAAGVGQMVSMGGQMEEITDFALWHRSIVHPDCKLFLFSEDLGTRLELKPETSREYLLSILKG